MSEERVLKPNKRTMVVSGNSVFREKDPVNPGMMQKFTNFVFDHQSQLSIKPAFTLNKGLVRGLSEPDTTMNRNGRSASLMGNVQVGGSPDARGVPRPKSTPLKKERY
jgi:hypothetical protein